MDYKIRINSPEHSMKVQNHLFSLGYEWSGPSADRYQMSTVYYPNYTQKYLVFDPDDKRIYYFNSVPPSELIEVELIETVSYELKEISKKEVVKIGENSYYMDELEIALKNINPI